jgi:hypothetical protein
LVIIKNLVDVHARELIAIVNPKLFEIKIDALPDPSGPLVPV